VKMHDAEVARTLNLSVNAMLFHIFQNNPDDAGLHATEAAHTARWLLREHPDALFTKLRLATAKNTSKARRRSYVACGLLAY
jgi:hypothetical protein